MAKTSERISPYIQASQVRKGEKIKESRREKIKESKREERREGRKERSGDKRIKGDWRSGEDTYGNISIETAAFGCDN